MRSRRRRARPLARAGPGCAGSGASSSAGRRSAGSSRRGSRRRSRHLRPRASGRSPRRRSSAALRGGRTSEGVTTAAPSAVACPRRRRVRSLDHRCSPGSRGYFCGTGPVVDAGAAADARRAPDMKKPLGPSAGRSRGARGRDSAGRLGEYYDEDLHSGNPTPRSEGCHAAAPSSLLCGSQSHTLDDPIRVPPGASDRPESVLPAGTTPRPSGAQDGARRPRCNEIRSPRAAPTTHCICY